MGRILVRVPYGGKYEISKTQWSNLASSLFGVASSQRCDIFQLTDGSELKRIYQLKAHTRVITDLDWSYFNPNLLATSSFDSYLYVWDLRCPRDPACEKAQVTLSALDGASQVTWNKWKPDCLASCDGGHIKIWDIHNPTIPLEYIPAHGSKINGLEWVSKDAVITAAQDCTAKFSRIGTPKIKGPCLTLSTPIWRARPTPFGKGIMTQSVPILRRDAGLLSLWNWQNFANPIYTFQGHDIVEFAWKCSGVSDLITWSRDQTLRIWSLPREIIELCGEEVLPASTKPVSLPTLTEDSPLQEIDNSDNSDTLAARLWNSENVSPRKEGIFEGKARKSVLNAAPSRDVILREEFENIMINTLENISFEQIDVDHGILKLGWKPDPIYRSVSIIVLISFPANYPPATPVFMVTNGGTDIDKSKLLQNLKQVAQSCIRRGERCLRSCIVAFGEFMNQSKSLEEQANPYLFAARGASNVPFPRTSGARFCSVGVLVCFGRPAYLKRVKSSCDAGTPRSLLALGPYLLQLTEDSSISTPHKSRRKKVEKKRAGLVTLFDVTPLLPVTRELAMNYRHASVSAAKKAICAENANVAKSQGKLGVSHAWTYCSIVSDYTCNYNHVEDGNEKVVTFEGNSLEDEEFNWTAYHPLGTELIHSIITHYAKLGDLQTAAAISCQFTVSGSNDAAGNCHHGLPLIQLSRTASSTDPACAKTDRSTRFASSQPWTMNLSGQANQPKPRLIVPKRWTKGQGSPYHTVHGSDTLHGYTVTSIPNPLSIFRQHRSNSWSESLDDVKSSTLSKGYEEAPRECAVNDLVCNRENWNLVLLDPTMAKLYDGFKKSYAEILYRWGYLQQRAEVMKCLTEGCDDSSLHSTVDYIITCPTCKEESRVPQCTTCKRVISICSICNMPAKGLCTFCSACGHGGHAQHVSQWFNGTRQSCPTGCGCECVEENNRTFN